MRIFDRRNETMDREELAQCQLERLQALLARLRHNVRRYRDRIGDVAVESLAGLAALPPTEPEDLIAAYPYGMFALPLREIIRLHSAVGPDGKQLVVGHTRNDLTRWGRLVARQLVAADVTAHDVIQICFGRGVFDKALGYLLGAELIEASVIPEDPFHIEYQLAMIQNYRATVLITSPTNASELVDYLEHTDKDPQSLSLRTVILSRPVPPAERERLERGLFADLKCNFGVEEVLDPGLCVECAEGRHHVNEDHFLVETRGDELLVTTLCREAVPLLRYCTRITAEIQTVKCACGRTGTVLLPGRRMDGRFMVRETPVYREQISGVLEHTQATGHPFELSVSEQGLVITLDMTKDLFRDTIRELEDLKLEIRSECFAHLGVEAQVHYQEAARGKAGPAS